MAQDAHKRVLLKLSGEALMGDLPFGIDPAMLDTIAGQLKAVQGMGIEVAIVVGAGHIFRGATAPPPGTGNPYRTTDTAAALRAIEIGADVLLMAKKNVNGVYEADPVKDPAARKFLRLSYLDALNRP